MKTFVWKIEYTFNGQAFSTLADTSCDRCPQGMAEEFEHRHKGTKVTRASLAFRSPEEVRRGIAGARMPHVPDQPGTPWQADQLDLL